MTSKILTVTETGEVYRPDGSTPAQYLLGGYLNIKFLNKRYAVHRLVAEKFISNPENKSDVNHKNGNKLDNNKDNLEWVTRKENILHSLRNGLHVLEETPVTNGIEIFVSQAEASRKTNICQSNINKCLKGFRKTAGGYKWNYVNGK